MKLGFSVFLVSFGNQKLQNFSTNLAFQFVFFKTFSSHFSTKIFVHLACITMTVLHALFFSCQILSCGAKIRFASVSKFVFKGNERSEES